MACLYATVKIYYQSFNGTYYDKMLDIIHSKQDVIDKIIMTEKEK